MKWRCDKELDSQKILRGSNLFETIPSEAMCMQHGQVVQLCFSHTWKISIRFICRKTGNAGRIHSLLEVHDFPS